jgi:hypothetical protein
MTPVIISLALSFALAAPSASPLPGAAVVVAAAPYWPPPERAKKTKKAPATTRSTPAKSTERPEKDAQAQDDDDELDEAPPPPPPPKAKPKREERKEAKKDEGEDPDDAMEDRRATTVRRSARPARRTDEDEEREEADEGPRPVTLPVVTPRLLAFELGGSLMGRMFKFNAPLQQEKTFPRPGVVAALELHPLLLMSGWFSNLGLGAQFEREFGNAGLPQGDGGTLNYAVTEMRWAIDVHYSFQLGERFVLVPYAGYGHSGYDIQRTNETTAPSACTGNIMQICLPDVQLSHMTLGLLARVAFTPTFGMSLGAAWLPAFGVGKAPGQIGAEAAPSATGFSGELAATWQLAGWLAARAAIPIVRYDYSWSAANLSYKSASEMYYGMVAGLVAWTN